MLKFKRFIFDFVNGIRSGIPVCCTLFFSWRRFIKPKEPVSETVSKTRGDPVSVGYVRCNCCYKSGKIAKVKKNGVIWKNLLGKN